MEVLGKIVGKNTKRSPKGAARMTEPWLLEQQRQDRWDAILARRPRCCLCGEPILEPEALVLEEKFYCDRCVSRCRQEVEEA